MTEQEAAERAGRPAHGQLSYLEIPALDRQQSAAFYHAVFGWKIRESGDDRAFTAPGGLIGRWHIPGGTASAAVPGLLPYISVDSIDAAIHAIQGSGGQVASGPTPEGDLWVATFRDPAGNLLGIWQHGPRDDASET